LGGLEEMTSNLRIVLIVIIIVGLLMILGVKDGDDQSLTIESIKKNLLPKLNYSCYDLIPDEILIGDEGKKLTTIDTNFTNGININYGRALFGSENCVRDLSVGSNIHDFSCDAKFYVIDNLNPDGLITKNSYLVSYNFKFDDRNCSILKKPGRIFGKPSWVREHPKATILSCKNFTSSCSWKYSEPPEGHGMKIMKININNIVKNV